ncbi:MAG: leucine-rich repeat domain-containing protein [Clostridia bacterium]|nr:leucine-rich repeat domain-containing protein [Clostridia bacterium]
MERMRLTFISDEQRGKIALCLQDNECKRLVTLIDEGEELFYEDGERKVRLCQGVLTLDGFEDVPAVFADYDGEYFDIYDKSNLSIKSRVKKVIVGEGAKAVCYGAFKYFTELCEIVLPDSIEYISTPFVGCSKLQPYALPRSLQEIEGRAYNSCPNEVVLPHGVEDVGITFNGSDISSIVISGSYKYIGKLTFCNCKNLKRVVFEEGVEQIQSFSFQRCILLDNVCFPKSLRYIGKEAFKGCERLQHVTFLGDTDVERDAFLDTPYQEVANISAFDSITTIAFEGDQNDIDGYSELKAHLYGKTLSEQASYFKLILDSHEGSYAYGDEEWTKRLDKALPLSMVSDVQNLVLLGGVIVGVTIRDKLLKVGKRTCIYSASEDDGVGRREVSENMTLVFVKH